MTMVTDAGGKFGQNYLIALIAFMSQCCVCRRRRRRRLSSSVCDVMYCG